MFTKVYDKCKKTIKENYQILIGIVVLLFLFFYELPFVVYRPGGTIDLKTRVVVNDAYETSGSLEMSYVSMMRGSIPITLLSFIIPNWDLVSAKKITLENENVEDSIIRDHLLLEEGLDNAIFAAFLEAGLEVKLEDKKEMIIYIAPQAKTDLKVGDIILSINGKSFENLEEIQTYINTLHNDEKISIQVLRDEKVVDCTANLYETENTLKIGVSIRDKVKYKTNPEVKIISKNSESGASGGLMTALQVYNSLTETDITKNRVIVGTGTIDKEGNVGEISGVKYKILGAEKHHANIFLCPKENYEEALSWKEKKHLKLEIIPVSTLKEAINALIK